MITILRARGLTTLDAERAALKLDLLGTEVEEIEQKGFHSLADEAEDQIRVRNVLNAVMTRLAAVNEDRDQGVDFTTDKAGQPDAIHIES